MANEISASLFQKPTDQGQDNKKLKDFLFQTNCNLPKPTATAETPKSSRYPRLASKYFAGSVCPQPPLNSWHGCSQFPYARATAIQIVIHLTIQLKP